MKREYKDGRLVPPIMSDRFTLESIVELLNEKEWDSEDLEKVAEFCRLAGYRIDPPSDTYVVTYSKTITVTVPWTESVGKVAHKAMPGFAAWSEMDMTYKLEEET